MPRKATLLKSLTRGRVRASWNKYNLFNLYKKAPVNFTGKSLFQQKWHAKSETRAYHGEHLTEHRWQQNFTPSLKGVAQLDSSLKGTDERETPMNLQTYAVLEKRLDFALFRAMFASSVRQARQFILHNNVTVNGIPIRHPNYELQQGDVFAVDPECVLSALGMKKPGLKQSYDVDKLQVIKWNTFINEATKNPYGVWKRLQEKRQKQAKVHTTQYDSSFLQNDEFSAKKIADYNDKVEKNMLSAQRNSSRSTIFKDILQIVRGAPSKDSLDQQKFNATFGDQLSEKCFNVFKLLGENHPLYETADLEKEVDSYMSRKNADVAEGELHTFKKVKQLLSEIHTSYLEKLRLDFQKKKADPNSTEIPYDADWIKRLRKHPNLPKKWDEVSELENPEKEIKVNLPWQKGFFGRADPSKPYFSPWAPRPFLAPFAILPQHLEVSFDTCHAVYLRDPVARPGESEVISPFGVDAHKRAYMWYIRKGL